MSDLPFEYEPGTARQILADHGLTEVAIDGVLYRHAHELAEKIRQAPFEPHLLQRHQRYRAARIIDPQADRE